MSICFLAVDIGTSSSKGTVIDTEANILAEGFIKHDDISIGSGHHEHDAEMIWWGEFLVLIKILQTQLDKSTEIVSVCISGMWLNFCPADAEGIPLQNAILYNDSRSVKIAQSLSPYIGTSINGYEYIPRIVWLQQNAPEVWTKTKKIFTTHNFIIYRLTGKYCIDSVTASVLGNCFDEKYFQWRYENFKDFGVSPDMLPQIYPPSTIIGHITESASRVTGLKSGIPVVAGTGDSLVSILGAGAHSANDGVIYYGSLGMFIRLTKEIEYILDTDSFIDGDGIQWLLSLTDSGKQLEWVEKTTKNKAGLDKADAEWKVFENLASVSEPGASGTVFVHDIQKHNEISVTLPPRAGIIGITTNTSIANISRAVLEGFGYAIRKSIEDSKLTLQDFNRVYASGGGAQSNLWREIVSEIIQFPQYYYPSSLGAVGGCILGAHAVGAVSIKDIAKHRVSHLQVPRQTNKSSSVYEINFQVYRHFSESIKQLA